MFFHQYSVMHLPHMTGVFVQDSWRVHFISDVVSSVTLYAKVHLAWIPRSIIHQVLISRKGEREKCKCGVHLSQRWHCSKNNLEIWIPLGKYSSQPSPIGSFGIHLSLRRAANVNKFLICVRCREGLQLWGARSSCLIGKICIVSCRVAPSTALIWHVLLGDTSFPHYPSL